MYVNLNTQQIFISPQITCNDSDYQISKMTLNVPKKEILN